LGKIYYNSISIENNCRSSFSWIIRSAEQGNREAQFRLGDLYALGHGNIKSLSDAYHWYTKAAVQGYRKALIRIHNLYQEDIKIRSRGQLSSEEKEHASEKFKKENNIRELFEYRVAQNQAILNDAIAYYTNQFRHYQSCNQEDPIVQLNLAFLYQHGYGLKRCIRWAVRYYTLAAEQGNIDAQYNLGELFQQDHDMKFNYRHAFQWYTKSAQGGSIAAQKSLAYFYLKGLATDIDYDIALSWYNKAAEAGDSEAQLILGKLYRKGDCIKQNLSIAVKWYTLAARQGNVVARNCLSQLQQRGMLSNVNLGEDEADYFAKEPMDKTICSKLSKDLARLVDSPHFEELNELGRCALIGDGHAMFEIGLKYYHDDSEFDQDQETGVNWIKNAAKAQHKQAQFMVADLYKKGESMLQDYHKAAIWYKQVAKTKDADAQRNVGLMYNEGLGVREDALEASKWFTWAADQKNKYAECDLGLLRSVGRGLRQDKEAAVDWFNKSAHQKNIQALCILGDIYFYGRLETKADTEKGLTLLEFAVKKGSIDAQKKIKDICEEGRDIDLDMDSYIECYTLAAKSGNAEAQYTLAIQCLNSDNWEKAYSWFKQAKDNGYQSAEWVFQTPIQYDPKINNYSKVINMFVKVTEEKIDDLSYHIGFLYENGVVYSGIQRSRIDYVKAKDWYLKASKNRDGRADYRLGMIYENGNGVNQKYDRAERYYKRGSKRGNGDASYKMATTYFIEDDISLHRFIQMYKNGRLVEQNLIKAYEFYQKASIEGHQEATRILHPFETKSRHYSHKFLKQIAMLEAATEDGLTGLEYQLGVMYKDRFDYVTAFKWLCTAAKNGVTDAYYKLGVMYEEGKGTERDFALAATMYQKAAEKEHQKACYRLARLYQYGQGVGSDYLTAYQFYKKAKELGHPDAYKVLNITLETNNGSTTPGGACFFLTSSPDFHNSLSMCKYVAEEGDIDVQFKVGFTYEYSLPEPNYGEAYKWYFMAASNSHTEAVYHLGLLYEKGAGVEQNYKRAIQLYKQANKQTSGDALYRLAIAYHQGRGVDVDLKKAIEYYIRSAELGNPKYQCELGRLYEQDGIIVEKNPLEATKWYTKAYLQGYDDIGPKLFTIYQDEPYEKFFYKKLLKTLSIAKHGYFSLNDRYNINDFGGINNRIASLYAFGCGIKKDLKTAWSYLSKKYDDHPKLTIHNFFIANQRSLSTSQMQAILLTFEDDEDFMKGILIEELYHLGMAYYDGVVEPQRTVKKNKITDYTTMDDCDDLKQRILLERDYSRAFTYLKRVADSRHIKALLQLGIMYHCGYGVLKNIELGDECFVDAADIDIETTSHVATVYHTYEGVQNFDKALEWYKKLENRLNGRLTYSDIKRIKEQVYLGFGLLYEYGHGVDRDHQKALEFYQKLDAYNQVLSKHRQGLLYYYGYDVTVDHIASFKLFENALCGNGWYGKELVYIRALEEEMVYSTMNRGEVIGENHYYLGLMYKLGQGTRQDKGKARDHFKCAFEHGCQRAKDEIDS
jgi:TPR repeat protein